MDATDKAALVDLAGKGVQAANAFQQAITSLFAPAGPVVVQTGGISLTLALSTGTLTFADSEAVDVGGYVGEFVHQKCSMVVKGPWRVFFRPDADGSRDEVVVEYGDPFAGPVAHITTPYTATITKNGAVVYSATVPQHWWLARWRWQSKPRPVVRDAATLKARKWIPNFGPIGLYGKPPVTTSMQWGGPMSAVAGLNPGMGAAGDHDQIGYLTEAGADYMIRPSDVTLATVRVEGEWFGNICMHMRDGAGKPLNIAGDQTLNYVSYKGKILDPVNPAVGTYPSFVYPEASHIYANATAGWLLTEDPFLLEELQFIENWALLQYQWTKIKAVLPYGQTRAYAWGLRDAFTLAATTPDSVPGWLLPKSYYTQIVLPANLAYSMQYVNAKARIHAYFRAWTMTDILDGWMSAWLSTMVGFGSQLFPEWRPVFDWSIQQQIDMASGTSGWDRRVPTPYEWFALTGKDVHSTLLTTAADAYTVADWSAAWAYWVNDPDLKLRPATRSPLNTSTWDPVAIHFETGISGTDTSYVGHHRSALAQALNMGRSDAKGAYVYLDAQYPVLLKSRGVTGQARFAVDPA